MLIDFVLTKFSAFMTVSLRHSCSAALPWRWFTRRSTWRTTGKHYGHLLPSLHLLNPSPPQPCLGARAILDSSPSSLHPVRPREGAHSRALFHPRQERGRQGLGLQHQGGRRGARLQSLSPAGCQWLSGAFKGKDTYCSYL